MTSIFLPPPDFGNGPKIGGGSWQWGLSAGCDNPEGALDYLKFSLQDKYVAAVSGNATGNIPATDAAAALVKGYEAGRDQGHLPAVLEEVRRGPAGNPRVPVHRDHLRPRPRRTSSTAPTRRQALDQAVSDIDANQQSNNFFQ